MAITYQRNTWETGKVITAKALNDIETGIVNIVEKLNSMGGEVASQTLTIENDASIGGNANIEGNASIGGTATVTGNATFSGSVEINGATTASAATINGTTIINGATTINNDITVGTDKHIILSASPSDNKHAVTKEYVDEKAITSTNDGITATGTLGSGISIELKPASTTVLGGIKVGQNLTINSGELDVPMASTDTNGLMSSTDFNKLAGIETGATANEGTVTGIQINGTVQEPNNGTVNIGNIVTEITMNNNSVPITNGNVNLGTVIQDISSKANRNSPAFTGLITLGATSIEEPALQKLNDLPQIPSLADDADDGTYVLQAIKTTPEGATEPVITYSWVSVSQQDSGGE